MKRTQAESEALRARILEELRREPQAMRTLCEKLNLGSRTGEKHFDALKLRGLIGWYGTQNRVTWATREVADKENARRKAAQDARSAQADARREKRKAKRAAENAALDAEIERETAGGWTATQRIVPAHSVRAEISGPRWVWDLAA